ncbi:NAD synthetase [Candidatus Marinamargulisbacteria bacterium SCGC AG-410-N11]|nr:NAD synthetase [Candidatus Marinamargulisbacteria bacterium SCGC AG-410-N11]
MEIFQNCVYIVSALFFILGLKKLSHPSTARQGNFLSVIGMFLGVVITLFDYQILDYKFIIVGILIGSLIGLFSARIVAMTSMPEMVALLNGFGGASSLFVGWSALVSTTMFSLFNNVVTGFSVFIGGLTFSGSIIAWAKLSEKISGKPFTYKGQMFVNILLLLICVVSIVFFVLSPIDYGFCFYIIIGLSLIIGILSVISIGGGDMPVVISLLNSYSGIAACFAGFVIENVLLIVAGSIVGASGLILTNIMCKAMNRSLFNVLFSGFGSLQSSQSNVDRGEVSPIVVDDAYLILEAARSVLIVPGYGMAVAQAQHVVKELSDLLESNGAEVSFAIHPVAGRMPGHMNVLLAEASVPYEQLVEMESVNPVIDSIDVCIVIGANDVVNPDARDNESSSIYGMPIIEVDKAKTVFVLKRSMKPGFAGIENPLFYMPNTRMLFGDAKSSIQSIVSQFKD